MKKKKQKQKQKQNKKQSKKQNKNKSKARKKQANRSIIVILLTFSAVDREIVSRWGHTEDYKMCKCCFSLNTQL
jgi:hypothetical protein